MTYSIAIIGRPNVGKSTLFNRMAGRRLALVDDMPGLTRDRREAEVRLGDDIVTLIDTAGLEEAAADTIQDRMMAQTRGAIADCNLVLFLIDARAGVTPVDETFADIIRSSAKPVIVVANKCEGRAGEGGFYESFSLGFGEPVAVSAEHNEGTGELYALIAVERRRAEAGQADGEEGGGKKDRSLRLAIVGRPNVGKSTLVNALLGVERMITGPEAGLTRDAISADLDWAGRRYRLFDTAGLRKKARVRQRPEQISVGDALRAIRFAEVVILLLDAGHPLEKQDLTIADLVAKEGRALVIAVNKWDLVDNKSRARRKLREDLDRLLPQIKGVPLVTLSALRGTGLDRLMEETGTINEIWNRRVSTNRLNRFLASAVDRHPPPAISGRRIRLRYMTQPNARPPTFIVFCSKAKNLPTAYERYLVNGLRKDFELPGVPIRLHVRTGKNPYAK